MEERSKNVGKSLFFTIVHVNYINNEITNCFSFLADPFVLFSVFPSIFQRLENSSLQVESCLLFWDQVFQLVSKMDKKAQELQKSYITMAK